MVCSLRPMTLSSASHSRTRGAIGGAAARRELPRRATTGARSSSPASSRLSRRLVGRPGCAPRTDLERRAGGASGARYRVTTVFEKPNGFDGFSTLFSTALQPPWSPAARVLKTRKPGPKDQVSNTGYRSRASPKSVGGEGEIRTLDGPVTHNGFRDRRLQPLGHLSESVPESALWLAGGHKWRSRPDS